ncbi:MAG: CsbD family protein [Pelovirga sp.]
MSSATIHNQQAEDAMKSSARDKAEGKLHEIKGKAREMAGKLTDNPRLEAEGTAEKISGKVQGKVGEVKTFLGE